MANNANIHFFNNRLNAARNIYQKDLTCHFGCVNAIEFSNSGELLVSGGDDRRVMLWQLDKTVLGQGNPVEMKATHRSAISSLGITNDHQKIYSGGYDDIVIIHNLETKSPVAVLQHEQAVCGLSIYPLNEHLVATAGNDGRLILFDTRQTANGKHRSMTVSDNRGPYQGVMFHPWVTWAMVSANAHHGVDLWDLRRPKKSLLPFVDTDGNSMYNSSSVRFNTSGSHVLALRQHKSPVLFNSRIPFPVAEFYHQDYLNSCTVKSCTFAGRDDQFVLSGSDDYNLYMWNVSGFDEEIRDASECSTVSPDMVLSGHRSIVNQVRYNTRYSLIASAGVEKIIKLWSAVEFPEKQDELLEEGQGSDNQREIGQYITNYADQSTSEDQYMMVYYDLLVQRELDSRAMKIASLLDTTGTDRSSSGDVKVKKGKTADSGHMVSEVPEGADEGPRSKSKFAHLVAPRHPKQKRRCNKNRRKKPSRSNLRKTKSQIVTRSKGKIIKAKQTPARRTRGPRIKPQGVGQSHPVVGQSHLKLGRSHSMVLRNSTISAPDSSVPTDSGSSGNSGRIKGPVTRSASKKITKVTTYRTTMNLRSNGNGTRQ